MATKKGGPPTPGSGQSSTRRNKGRPGQIVGAGRGDGKFVKRGNDRYHRHDAYYKQAKRDGFVARSVYKLDEIDQQYSLFSPGDRVLDLGCAPGSWLQYVSERLQPRRGGSAVGVDLLEMAISFPPHVRVMVGDVFDLGPEDLLGDSDARFDLVLSDMAPNMTGIRSVDQIRSIALCECALELCTRVLGPGGNFCTKVLEGGEVHAFIKSCRAVFDEVKIRRPKGTRAGSMETYIVALRYRAPSVSEEATSTVEPE